MNPESPDSTHEVIASMAGAYPEIRLSEIAVAAKYLDRIFGGKSRVRITRVITEGKCPKE